MKEGRVLAAARVQGLESLAKVAKALIEKYPHLFEGVEVRSLGAKLSDLNRGKHTWWRDRADRVHALTNLIGLEIEDLIASEQAQKRGLWVFEEFPELPALNLSNEQPPNLGETVALESAGAHLSDWDTWQSVALGPDYEQLPLHRLGSGLVWLHVPEGTGRGLLVSRIQARNRLPVYLGNTLAEAVSQVSPSTPAVLAPDGPVSGLDMVALAQLDPVQPVLVISAHPLPRTDGKTFSKPYLPSWEWLSATRTERTRTAFAAGGGAMSGGILEKYHAHELKLQLLPTWRQQLLRWIENRLSRHSDTLFSSQGLSEWLDAFDPDEVFFPTPSALLSLARICHEVGERRLPKPDSPDAGLRLLERLGRADSRYQSLLARLVTHRWLDGRTPWNQARPWDEWFVAGERRSAPPRRKQAAIARESSGPRDAKERALAPLTEQELTAAFEANILVPDTSGNYGFRSHAEAALLLRDQLRAWMQAGEFSKWGAQSIGDPERQQLIDTVMSALDNKTVVDMCRLVVRLPVWSAESLGASETLLLTAGSRMAAGTQHYRIEFGELLKLTLARVVDEEGYVPLPLSRTQMTSTDRLIWTRAFWGWSLVAPKPAWIPVVMVESFPGWATEPVDWLWNLSVPEATYENIAAGRFKKIAAAVNTAVVLAERLDASITGSLASEVVKSLVDLLRAIRGKGEVAPRWWHSISEHYWALEILESSIVDLATETRLKLAASLIEACCTPTDERFSILMLVRSQIWLQLLNVKEQAELCNRLSPAAMAFLVRHIQAVPPKLRREIASRVDPDSLPFPTDWLALLSAADLPDNHRLGQLLRGDFKQIYGVTAALWTLYPEQCVAWAVDPQNSHRAYFREQCPSQWVPDLAAALMQSPRIEAEAKTHQNWALRQIADAGHRAPALLQLLSSNDCTVSS